MGRVGTGEALAEPFIGLIDRFTKAAGEAYSLELFLVFFKYFPGFAKVEDGHHLQPTFFHSQTVFQTRYWVADNVQTYSLVPAAVSSFSAKLVEIYGLAAIPGRKGTAVKNGGLNRPGRSRLGLIP